MENTSSPLHHPTTLVFLAATRWRLQLPVFKHPLEPLRTTVLPSTSQTPWNINIFYWNLLQWYNVHQWLTSLITILLQCPTLSASLYSYTHALHFLFFCLLCSVCHVHSMHHSSCPCFCYYTLLLLHSLITLNNRNTHLFFVLHTYSLCPCYLSMLLHALSMSSALPNHHGHSSAYLVV